MNQERFKGMAKFSVKLTWSFTKEAFKAFKTGGEVVCSGVKSLLSPIIVAREAYEKQQTDQFVRTVLDLAKTSRKPWYLYG